MRDIANFECADTKLLQSFCQPMHSPVAWSKRSKKKDEYSFECGIGVRIDFPDLEEKLESALADFSLFLSHQNVLSEERANLSIALERTFVRDEHRITVQSNAISLHAGDVDGVRRGLVWIEDEMLKRGGPFLPLGIHHRHPVIATRISRCFFGPIQRPPFNRNELADEVDYYPEPYLNRLAHEGVNALWITVKLQESLPSALFPEYGREAAKHLTKLRRTVERCARYGIRIYAFCIEPAALPVDSPIFQRHPELKGHVVDDLATFCPSTAIGQAYLEEAGRTLLKEVPGLGGIIVIPVGERFTHCASIFQSREGNPQPPCNCPRCAPRTPYEILHDTLAGLRRGMDGADPTAELIAWPYGQLILWGDAMTVESAKHIPPGVVLQHNFESGGVNIQLGKERPLWDYWLSWIGPSAIFREAARLTAARGGRMSAKLQVGNSHEIATVPFVPVPGLLYRKYRAMHEMGVSSAMQSWYFGNYPSIMTRAAGLLSFAPFPATESGFLLDLARRDWGKEARTVARAWSLFGRAYENYPATHFFGYYGPVQDGVVWPLHLIPRNRPLAPTWKLDFPPSGDYLADCLSSYFTLKEVIMLCTRMVHFWKQGILALNQAFAASVQSPSQWHEKRVSEAIGVNFESGLEILRFYALREELVEAGTTDKRLEILDAMEAIVPQEIARRRLMLEFLRQEPTLGYHSEAEGFKVTPELVQRGIRSLQRLLKKEFPAIRQAAIGTAWFGDYTGRAPRRKVLWLRGSKQAPWLEDPERNAPGRPNAEVWKKAPSFRMSHWLIQLKPDDKKRIYDSNWKQSAAGPARVTARFRALIHDKQLALVVELTPLDNDGFSLARSSWQATVIIEVEPARLRPRIQFSINATGFKRSLKDEGYLAKQQPPFDADWIAHAKGWQATLAIPFSTLGVRSTHKPFRFNARIAFFNKATGERCELSWIKRHPLKTRLAWDDINPATDYGWSCQEASRTH